MKFHPGFATSRLTCILAASSIFVIAMLWYGYCASILPGYFGADGYINHSATRYLAEHRKIPVLRADDPEIPFTSLGTTRLSRPPLTYIISAFFYSASASIINDTGFRLRLGSVVLGSITLVVAFIGLLQVTQHLGMAIAGTILIGGLPRLTFLASTNNDDIGAIFAATLLFTSLIWLYRKQFRVAKAYLFVAAVGLTLIAKFTAWLLLPWAAILAAPILWARRQILRRQLPILCLIVVLFGAWWPLGNMVHYGWDDPTALQHAEQIQVTLEGGTPNERGYWSRDVTAWQLLQNHDNFLSVSLKSTVGYMPWLELDMRSDLYLLYGLLAACALVSACLAMRDPLAYDNRLGVVALFMVLAQLAFYMHHNLQRDVQLDARYFLPILMPCAYLIFSALGSIQSRVFVPNAMGIVFSLRTAFAVLLSILSIALFVFNWQTNVLLHA